MNIGRRKLISRLGKIVSVVTPDRTGLPQLTFCDIIIREVTFITHLLRKHGAIVRHRLPFLFCLCNLKQFVAFTDKGNNQSEDAHHFEMKT